MIKRIEPLISLLLPLAFTSLTAACMVEDDMASEGDIAGQPGDVQQQDDQLIADGDQAGAADQSGSANSQPGTLYIQLGEINGICAQTLTLRNLPGGDHDLCTMVRGNHAWADYTDGGAWAYIEVTNGPCGGYVGWALKDWISRHCL